MREIGDVPYRFVPGLRQLADESEALILAASADEAEGIINAGVPDVLGPDGYLINVARGKLINEADLVQALTTKRIAGASLDVFVDEPNVPTAPIVIGFVVASTGSFDRALWFVGGARNRCHTRVWCPCRTL